MLASSYLSEYCEFRAETLRLGNLWYDEQIVRFQAFSRKTGVFSPGRSTPSWARTQARSASQITTAEFAIPPPHPALMM